MDAPAAAPDEMMCDVCEQWPAARDQKMPVWVCGACRDERIRWRNKLSKYWRTQRHREERAA